MRTAQQTSGGRLGVRAKILVVLAIICTAAGSAEVAAETVTAACPDGHVTAVDTEGPYYVYMPNLPGGYSVVWVNETRTDIPPPGVYGAEGDRVLVCYTDDIHAYAEQIGHGVAAASTEPPVSDAGVCVVDGEEGIPMADGTCMTPSRYDDVFSASALAEVASQAVEGATVADLCDLGNTPASHRSAASMRTFEEHVRVLCGQLAL